MALVLLLFLHSLILHKDQLRRLLRRHEVVVLLEVLITSHVPIWTILILSLIGSKGHSLRHVRLLLRKICESEVINSALCDELLSQGSLFSHLGHDQLFTLLNRVHFLVVLLVSLLRIREERSFCEGLRFQLFAAKLAADWIASI